MKVKLQDPPYIWQDMHMIHLTVGAFVDIKIFSEINYH